MPDPFEISKEELAEWLTGAQLKELADDPDDFDAVLEYLRGVIKAEALAVQPALYERIRAGLTADADPEAIAKALDLANTAADTLGKNIAKAELNSIGKTIADGIDAGLGPREIGRNLDMVKGLDSGRAATLGKYRDWLDSLDPKLSEEEFNRRLETKFRGLLRDRKRVIAQTEQRVATGHANRLEADERGAKWKMWITVGDSRVDVEDCLANEAQGPIPIGDAYQNGSQTVPAHPGCRCTESYILSTDHKKKAAVRAEARAESTAAAIEAGNAQSEAEKAEAAAVVAV